MASFSLLLLAHLLGAVVWVGGMFFSLLILHPAMIAALEPPQRAKLAQAVFQRFFLYVWISLPLVLVSGHVMNALLGQVPAHLLVMTAIGWLMAAIFLALFFGPYRSFRKHIAESAVPQAMAQAKTMRALIWTNLFLGLLEIFLGVAGHLLF